MPKRRHKRLPTPWQQAKPAILAGLEAALVGRGFLEPGLVMSRRRSDFIDVIELWSKYGTDCVVFFGCEPARPGDPVPRMSSCTFRDTVHGQLAIPSDPALLPQFVGDNLVPRVVHVVESWFPRFASLESASSLLDDRTSELCGFNKPSPAYAQARAKLDECIRQRSEVFSPRV